MKKKFQINLGNSIGTLCIDEISNPKKDALIDLYASGHWVGYLHKHTLKYIITVNSGGFNIIVYALKGAK